MSGGTTGERTETRGVRSGSERAVGVCEIIVAEIQTSKFQTPNAAERSSSFRSTILPMDGPARLEAIAASDALFPTDASGARPFPHLADAATVRQIATCIVRPAEQHSSGIRDMRGLPIPNRSQSPGFAETPFVGLTRRVVVR